MPTYHGYDHPLHGHERWSKEYYTSTLLYGDIADLSDGRFRDRSHRMSDNPNAPYEYDSRHWNARSTPITPIERRSRRAWPPCPRVEDEATSLSHEFQPPPFDTETSEASFRGHIDQQPIILEVNELISTVPPRSQTGKSEEDLRSLKSRSSSESLGSHTPDTVDENQDRRYVYIPEKGIEIPLTYDEPRTEKKPRPIEHSDRERGRKDTPRLDTKLSRKKSLEHVQSPLERERSPYAHAPKPSRLKEARFSGEYLLSPDILSPKIRFPEAGHGHEASKKVDSPGKIPGQAAISPEQPARPPMHRHVSATAYPGEPASADGFRRRLSRYEVSSDETDDGAEESSHTLLFPSPGPGSQSDLTRDRPVPRLDGPVPQNGRKHVSTQRHVSPPLRPRSACDHRAPAPRVLLPTGLGPPSGSILSLSSQLNARRASPRCSPAGTPHSSPATTPPGTPPSNVHQRKNEFKKTKSNTLPIPRPSSPIQAPQSAKPPYIAALDVRGIDESRPGLRSRQTSPLPSPGYDSSSSGVRRPRSRQASPIPSPRDERSCFEHGPRIDIREPSPAYHNRSSSYTTDSLHRLETRHASMLPYDMPSSPTLRLPQTGHRRRASSNAETRPNLTTDPLILQKAFDSPHAAMKLRPLGPARAVSVGPAPPATLPSCPRKDFAAGHSDWYTLVGFPSFAMCPTCRDAVMIPGYAHHFTPRAPKPRAEKTRCDFSVPWMRMAWLMTLSQKRPDVNLLYAVAEVAAYETPCPGKVEAIRDWHKLDDPNNGRHVSNFNVCPYCVRNVETLFPVLRGILRKARSHHSAQERICDLRIDSQRFSCYVDLLEETANQAMQFRRAPNTLRFVEFAKRMVLNRECPGEDVLRGQAWYIMPSIPEFTACEECYDLTVHPAIKRGSSIATQFTRKPQFVAPPHVGVSCQLHSPRMKRVFREACERNDFHHLRNVAVQRYRAERNLQLYYKECHRYLEDEKADRLTDLVKEWRRWE